MSQPQYIVFGVGGEIYVYLPSQATNARVAIKDDAGGNICSGAATISTISTVTNLAVNRGAWNISVENASGLSSGSKVWLGGDKEEVLIRTTSANYIQLRRPLIYDHVNSTTVKGTRVSYAVNAAEANSLFWAGRAEWNIDSNYYDCTAIHCTKYPMRRLATAQDIFDEEPKFNALKDAEIDVERQLDLAHDEVMSRIAASAPDQRAHVFTASHEFNKATVYAFLWWLYGRTKGDEARAQAKHYEEKLTAEINRIVPALPRDADQDGAVTRTEQYSPRSVKLFR